MSKRACKVIFCVFLAFSTYFGHTSAATMLRDPELSRFGDLQTKLQRICDLVPSACGDAWKNDLMMKRGILDLMNS